MTLVEPRVAGRSGAGAQRRERAFGAAAVTTSLVVGTALTLINHPEVAIRGVTWDLLMPLLLNYAVPFLVAGYSRHRLLRRHTDVGNRWGKEGR